MSQRNQISDVILSMGVDFGCSTTPERIQLAREFFQEYGVDGNLTIDRSVYVRSSIPNSIPNVEITFSTVKKIDIKHLFEKMDLGGKTKTNNTCSTYMRFKFVNKRRAIAVFSSQGAWTEFRNAYIEFARTRSDPAKYMRRLKGRYCKFPAVRPAMRLKGVSGRYYAINVQPLLERQNTLEIRIMPGFDNVKEAMEAVNFEIKTLSRIYKKS